MVGTIYLDNAAEVLRVLKEDGMMLSEPNMPEAQIGPPDSDQVWYDTSREVLQEIEASMQSHGLTREYIQPPNCMASWYIVAEGNEKAERYRVPPPSDSSDD